MPLLSTCRQSAPRSLGSKCAGQQSSAKLQQLHTRAAFPSLLLSQVQQLPRLPRLPRLVLLARARAGVLQASKLLASMVRHQQPPQQQQQAGQQPRSLPPRSLQVLRRTLQVGLSCFPTCTFCVAKTPHRYTCRCHPGMKPLAFSGATASKLLGDWVVVSGRHNSAQGDTRNRPMMIMRQGIHIVKIAASFPLEVLLSGTRVGRLA